MKIKTIEDFTIEECQEFLDCFPEDERASAVREHMTTLMKEKEQQMEDEKKKALEAEEKVSWLDFRHFCDIRPRYKNLNALLISLLFFFMLGLVWCVVTICNTGLEMGVYDASDEAYFQVINDAHDSFRSLYPISESLHLLYLDYYNKAPYGSGKAELHFRTAIGQGGVALICIVCFTLLLLITLLFFNSSVLVADDIRDIENPDGKECVRVRGHARCIGLCRLGKTRMSVLLPPSYDHILTCGKNAFICVSGAKYGLYHIGEKRMVLPVAYDRIARLSDDIVEVVDGSRIEKFTIKGFRIVED